MKLLIALSMFSLSLMSFAGDIPREEYMTIEAQNEYVTQVAKSIRRDLWVNGYEDVVSNEYFVTKSMLDEHVKQGNNYENHLDSDEVSELYKCYYRSFCELYLVRVSSNYWGGYGEEAHFVALNTEKGKHEVFSHVVYAE